MFLHDTVIRAEEAISGRLNYQALFATSLLDPETKMGGEAITYLPVLPITWSCLNILHLQKPCGFHITLWSL